MNVLIARSVGIDEYGAFVIAFTTYTLGLGVSRQLASTPLLVRYTTASASERKYATSASAGTAVCLGITMGLLIVATAQIAPPRLGSPLLILAVSLPGLLLQDAWRMALFTHGRPRSAAANDLAWAIFQMGGIFVVLTRGSSTLEEFMAVWGLSGGFAALFGAYQLRTLPAIRAGVTWANRQRDQSLPLLGEFVAYTGSRHVAVYIVAGIGGIPVAGALGAATMLLGALNILFMAAVLLGIPEGARLRRESSLMLRRGAVVLSAALGSIACLWATSLYLLPASAGEFILGSTWHEAHPLLPLVGLVWVATGLSIGPRVALKVDEQAQALLRVSTLASPVNIGARTLGVSSGGATGAAAGYAAAAWVEAALLWRRYLLTTTQEPSNRDRPPTRTLDETTQHPPEAELPQG